MITTMGRRGIRRSSRLIAVAAAVYLTGVATRGARASAPACFAERTVFESVALRDDRFVAFGGLRQGQEVHVRDEPGADGGKWSAVEIARPIAVTGLAERHKLVVFARVEIEAQPGLAWLLAGAPLAIVSGDQERARVVVARPEGEKPQLPAVDVPCTLLRGTAPPEIVGWDFEGPLHRDRAARIAGPPVDWKGERQLESEAGARSVPLYGRAELIDGRRRASILVSAAGDRALIVIVDRYEWTRHRGWTPRAGLDTRRPRKSPDVMCGCLEGASWLTVTYPPKPSVKLAAAAELRAENGRPVVTLPAGETVSPLSVTGDRTFVFWTGRTPGSVGSDPQQVLFGVVPTAAIAALPAAAVNAIVEGSIKAGPEGGALQRPMIVKAEWGRGEVERRAETPAGPDGSFRLQSPVNRGFLTVWAESRDGTVLSAREYVRPEPGKTARVELKIQPANWQ